jgi:glyoxylase-like metal-dependent hydrolase (beta-lactamase superfamily II)
MTGRLVLAFGCTTLVAALGWLSTGSPAPATESKKWEHIGHDIYRTRTSPFSHALVHKGRALLIDASASPEDLEELGAIDTVILTHHHRDTASFADAYRRKGIPVRAPRMSADWLTPAGVAQFWKDSIPLRNSRTAYFVLPVGIEGIDCTLEEARPFAFGGWNITPVATPGHSRDHLAYLAEGTTEPKAPSYLFCGDAFCTAGKMWTPFTTDWDHWTDAGLKPAAESLRKMAKLKAEVLCPAHGPVLDRNISAALEESARAIDDAAFLKSFERFTKDRLGNPPTYDFLVPAEQVASAGDKPWARVSDHLWITGNTYVLKAKEGDGILVLDPWGQRSADQVEKLRKEHKLGPIEVVGFSHAHYDHFDGIHVLNGRDRCEVWALDLVAIPLEDPLLVRAPFLDPRPIKFTRKYRDRETAAWGGYTFKFHHLPGQSWHTSGIEVSIDGKRCLFTADNFFHQKQFSGSGGWMGLNRSSPAVYGSSARKVLDLAPEWVLAEHGGPYVFDREDYRRRGLWGEAGGKAADALSVTRNHLRDWTPHRVTVEPVLQTVRPGGTIKVQVALNEPRLEGTARVTLLGRGLFEDVGVEFPGRGEANTRRVAITLSRNAPEGLHVFSARVVDASGTEPADPYFAIKVVGKE